jgi:large subunit ribosomal protein L3
MKFILGKKLNMSQIFKDDGTVVPVTLIKAGPCYVTYSRQAQAVQIGFEETKERRLTKAERGHLKQIGKNLKYLKEFRIGNKESGIINDDGLQVGKEIRVDIFKEGDRVQVVAISKGKGFQGVVKRHRFSGSPATHGHKDQLRMPGSIGATNPQRVIKGRKMAGHMGAERVTVKNLEVAKVDAEAGILYLRGAVPGARGGLVKICSLS